MCNYKNLAEEEMNKSIASFYKSNLNSAVTHLELAEFYLKQQLYISYEYNLEEFLSNSYSKLTYYNFLLAQKALKNEDFKSAFIFFSKAKKYCLNNNFKFNNQKFNRSKDTTEFNKEYMEENICLCLEKLKNIAKHNSNIAIWLSEQYEYGDYLEKSIENATFYYGLAILMENSNATKEHLNYLEECEKKEFDKFLILAKEIVKNREKLNKTELIHRKMSNLRKNKNSTQNLRKSAKLWDNNNAILPSIIIKHY